LLRLSTGRDVEEADLQGQDVPWLVAVVLIGGGFGRALLMLGLCSASASSAAFS
jgi:hypothetical protein